MPNIFLRFRILILFSLCFKFLHHFSEDRVFFNFLIFIVYARLWWDRNGKEILLFLTSSSSQFFTTWWSMGKKNKPVNL